MANSKQMKFTTAAQAELKKGVDAIARAVAVTMGPTGRNVVIAKGWGSPHVTKDGVTVAKEVELAEPFANMGARMVQQVAKKTADVAGDGTTAATVLAVEQEASGLRISPVTSTQRDMSTCRLASALKLLMTSAN